MPIVIRPRIAGLLALALSLTACQPSSEAPAPQLMASRGQVSAAAAVPVTRYAAARFADQVSFGATPELVAEIENKGFEKWIDEQFALPPTLVDTSPIAWYDSQIPQEGDRAFRYADMELTKSYLNAPDQLRLRVSFALSQFIVASIRKIEPYGGLAYSNLLQQHAFGNYGALLRAVTINPSMGIYLDNLQNRPTSKECPWCAPNENYARELLQLFALGVVKLRADGSIERDGAGRPVETYSQADVEELARALTGWTLKTHGDRLDFRARYDGEMVEEQWAAAHDRGAKNILGTAIGAGQNASKELDAVVSLLMGHQNIAPFVSLRMIQHLVTSDPSPAYIARVSAAFRNNGAGVAGDMRAIVRAVLLDPEARRGDKPGADVASFGKMREPQLWYTGLLRGLGCKLPLTWDNGHIARSGIQTPYNADSVFSFYLPTDRAPGSNLLAPEQRLLTAQELSWRIGAYTRNAATCDTAAFADALNRSHTAFVDLVSSRYFRNAMPPVLRQNLLALAPTVWGETPADKALALLKFALATPYYGAIR